MNIERILFKVSGDLIEDKEVLNEIKEEAKTKFKLIDLIYGFGTKLSDELNKADIEFKYVNGIRETSEEGDKIALKVSDEIKSYLKKEFAEYTIGLISPVKMLNGKMTNTNADEIVMQKHKEYDKVIIYCRHGKNKDKFKEIKNLEIRYK